MPMNLDVVFGTLVESDPEFGMLLDALYGDVDPQVVYNDVVGIAKFEGKQESTKDRTLKHIGLGATAIGAGLGVKEIGEGLSHKTPTGEYTFKRVGPKASKTVHAVEGAWPKALKQPKVRLALVGGMIGGDLIATHGLAHSGDVKKANGGDLLLRGLRGSVRIGGNVVAGGAKGLNQAATRPVSQAIGRPGTVKIRAYGTRGGKVSIKPTDFHTQIGGKTVGIKPRVQPTVPKPDLGEAEIAARAKSAGRMQEIGASIKSPMSLVRRHPVAASVAAVGTGGYLEHRRNNRPIKQATLDPYSEPVSPYAKNDPSFQAAGVFSKFDDDKRLAFGWASIVEKNGLPVLDRQGDYITSEDLEEAAYRYVLSSRVGGDMHRRTASKSTGLVDRTDDKPHHVSDLVESFVLTKEKIAKMGLPADSPVGWWVGFKVHDDDTWAEVRKGGRTGFSIHGKGRRSDIDLDSLVGA